MDLPQILDFINNSISLVLLIATGVVGIFIFFSDPLRRWRFFGYLPTAIIGLVDPIRKKILVVQFDTQYYGHRIPPMLPQGGIYSNHIGETIREVCEKELGLSSNFFDIKHIRELGELNIQKHKERIQKYQYGILGISPLILGKGYIGCLCICDSKEVMKHVRKGVGVEKVYFVDLVDFKKEQKLQDDTFDGKRILYNKHIVFVENYLKGIN